VLDHRGAFSWRRMGGENSLNISIAGRRLPLCGFAAHLTERVESL
jgi:hypothetical protein